MWTVNENVNLLYELHRAGRSLTLSSSVMMLNKLLGLRMEGDLDSGLWAHAGIRVLWGWLGESGTRYCFLSLEGMDMDKFKRDCIENRRGLYSVAIQKIWICECLELSRVDLLKFNWKLYYVVSIVLRQYAFVEIWILIIRQLGSYSTCPL